MIDWKNIYTYFLESRKVQIKEEKQQYHKHHIVPRYLDRSKKNKETVLLTVQDHATAHWILYKAYNNIQDKYAWCMLSGKTSMSEELRKLMAKQTPESIQKMLITRRKNNSQYKAKGELNAMSKLTERNILQIYSLIKKGYSDREIIKILNLEVKNGAIHGIRHGTGWKHLWKDHFTEPIPSFFKNGNNGLSARIKLKIFNWIDKGYTPEQISRHTKVNLYDIKYAVDGKIWKKVREYYVKQKENSKLNRI